MKQFLLVSVAATALLGVTAMAGAQGTSPGGEGASPKGAQGTSPGGMKGPDAPASTTPRANPTNERPATRGSETTQPSRGTNESSPRTQSDGKTNGAPQQTQDRGGRSGTQTPDTKTPSAADKNPATTEKSGATATTAAPPAKKRTQIVTTIKQEKVDEVKNVNFNISVGAVVPSTVTYHRLPSRIIEIYPEWRGYEYILVQGRYIILQPETHKIVYIIED